MKIDKYPYSKQKTGNALRLAKEQRQFVIDTLDETSWQYSDDKNLKIISGAAEGPDSIAIEWAMINDIAFKPYPADWKKHKKAAGPIRNQLMLDSEVEYPEECLLLAFPGGKGTADMIRRTLKLNIEVIEPKFESTFKSI